MSTGNNKSSHAPLKWVAGVLATVVSGVAVFWLTEGVKSSPPTPIARTSQECSDAAPESMLQASMSGELSRIQSLLRCGADPNARAVWQQELPDNDLMELTATPLHAASWNKQTGVVQVLLEAGANVDALDEWGFSPLMTAAEVGAVDIVSFLINAGADVDLIASCLECGDETALILAAHYGHSDVVELLVRSDANVNHRNYDDLTALDIAKQKEHTEVVNILQSR